MHDAGGMWLSHRPLAVLLICGLNAACAARANLQTAPAHDNGEQPHDVGHKSYVLPAVEIVAMDAAVNRVGGLLLEPATFDVTTHSIRHNLRGPWVVDDDPFEVNQFGHP